MSARLAFAGLSMGALIWSLSPVAVAQESPDERQAVLAVDSQRSLGLYLPALNILDRLEVQPSDALAAGVLHAQRAAAYLMLGDENATLTEVTVGLERARSVGNDRLEAVLLDIEAGVYLVNDNPEQAVRGFRLARTAARRGGDPHLIAQTEVNLSHAMFQAGYRAESLTRILRTARQSIEKVGKPEERAGLLLSLGELHGRADLAADGSLRIVGFELLKEALAIADKQGNKRTASYARGYIGRLYALEDRLEESIRMTRRALFDAMENDIPEGIYLWEWQLGRLTARSGEVEDAIGMYRRAIGQLADIRVSLTRTGAFKTLVAPVYFELADLILKNPAPGSDELARSRQLYEVRATLEGLKSAEIVDYFDNDCVVAQEQTSELDQLEEGAAVLYPVLFDDRVELLVSNRGSIVHETAFVSRAELTQVVRRFRRDIEFPGQDTAYLDDAQRLYTWLIEPIEDFLSTADVQTLVVVPDGPLRTIPMSALFDGQKFLIERYAMATTPGLSLVDPRPINQGEGRLLANGITEPVQGFAALPNVEQELTLISGLYAGELNLNEAFDLDSVEQSMAQGAYSIVHIATHGQFDRDHQNSFLLTYDDKLTMNRLEDVIGLRRYQEDAVELLVLSACQTAAGDDRAALGMAGVALKAGARSAVASLWFINDASTAELMGDFYSNLRQLRTTKAFALQQAQLDMLREEQFAHPAYWAPFLLIGNWL